MPTRRERIAQRRQGRKGGHLVVGKVVAEFGWELMSIGPLRYYVHQHGFDKVTVCTRPGREALYADFATEFKPHDIQCESALMSGYKLVDGNRVDLPVERPRIPNADDWYRPQTYNGGRAEWRVYGEMRAERLGVTVFHARNRPHCPERNWPVKNWTALADNLRKASLAEKIVCIGTPEAAAMVPGCDDARSVSLAGQMDILHSAAYAVGVSSGPMHLAQHCKCPVVVWCGGGAGEQANTQRRYKEAWNPFLVPFIAVREGSWQPLVNDVVDWTTQFGAMLSALEENVAIDEQ